MPTFIEVATTASASEVTWAFTWCVASFGFGFIVGMKLKMIRKIEDMA